VQVYPIAKADHIVASSLFPRPFAIQSAPMRHDKAGKDMILISPMFPSLHRE
jgi:hypothetical protein